MRGEWVICDRFVDSSRAYQGGGGGLSDAEVMDLHRIGSGGLLPDLTLLVEVSPETAAHRLDLRDAGNAEAVLADACERGEPMAARRLQAHEHADRFEDRGFPLGIVASEDGACLGCFEIERLKAPEID